MARTPNGTPPERRGHGYGSSVTAALSRRLLDEGKRFCFLYTDPGARWLRRYWQTVYVQVTLVTFVE